MQWVTDLTSDTKTSPRLVDVGAQGDLFVLSDTPAGPDHTDLVLQRLSAEGDIRWSTKIPANAPDELMPAMVVHDGDRTTVAWTSVVVESIAGGDAPAVVDASIAMATVGADGTLVGTITIPHRHGALLLEVSASGYVIVASNREGDQGTTLESWGPDGSPAWSTLVPDVGFIPDLSGFVHTTAIRAMADGGVAVAGLVDTTETSRTAQVRAFDAAGNPRWTTSLEPFAQPITHVSLHALPGGLAVGVGNPYEGVDDGVDLAYVSCDGTVSGRSVLAWVNRIDRLVGSADRQTALGLHVWGEGYDSNLLAARPGSTTPQDQLRWIGGAVGEIGGYPRNFLDDMAATPDGGLVLVGSVTTSSPIVPTPPDHPRVIAIKLAAPAGAGSISDIPDIFGLDRE